MTTLPHQHQRYNKSNKGIERSRRYRSTDKGHANERRNIVRFGVRRREANIEARF
jgi:hypothetical protein